MSFKRNTYSEATFSLSHEDDAAYLLLDAMGSGAPGAVAAGGRHASGLSFGVVGGLPTLRCYRRGPNDSAGVLRFNGYLAPFQEDAGDDASTLALTFRSPFGRLAGDGSERGRFTDANVPFTAQDAGIIAKSLIDATNANDGPTGLDTTGTIAATKVRDRTYQFANVGEAVTNLTNVLDGFDFYETFVEQGTTLAAFNVAARQGQDNPAARFEHGADTLSNVRSVTRTTAPPINVARVLGANGLYGLKTDPTSVAQFGVWPIQVSASDVSEQATLDDKAQALLRPNPVKTIQFVPELGLDSCPKPWDNFWLGDTVPFFARRAALYEDVSARVNAITVAIDENGFEVAELPDESRADDVDPFHENESDPFTTQSSVDVEVTE